MGGTAFVWYYTYPLLACYLLGSRMGGIASGLMLVPVLAMLCMDTSHAFFAQYDPSFVGRFIAAYILTAAFAYLFQWTREKNQSEIDAITRSLEKLVDIRTHALAEVNAQL